MERLASFPMNEVGHLNKIYSLLLSLLAERLVSTCLTQLSIDRRDFPKEHFKPNQSSRPKVADHKKPQPAESQTPSKPVPASEKPAASKSDNSLNMESTWKVAFRPYKSRNSPKPSSPKPKKQPKTQTATAESRNFPVAKIAT